METAVELESRNCKSCGRPYWATPRSEQSLCSYFCKLSGLRWNGKHHKILNAMKTVILDADEIAKAGHIDRKSFAELKAFWKPKGV